jgi:hypothetical protein
MGDYTDADRRLGQPADMVDDDPFAELARLIDAPIPVSSPAAPAESPRGQQPLPSEDVSVEFDLDMEAFAGALDDELAREEMAPAPRGSAAPASDATGVSPNVAAAYSDWISPKSHAAVRSAPAPFVAASPALVAAEESDLEVALRGLSAPANPRDAKYQVSEAFAPERIEEPGLPEPAGQVFDDFDALIASELAAMQAAPLPQTRDVEPSAAGQTVAASAAQATDWEAAPASPAPRQPASGARRRIMSDARSGHVAAAPSGAAGGQRPFSRRVVGVGASLLVVALMGGTATYLLSGNGGTVYDAPLIVRADADPVKVAPKDPGGRAIPNQNKAVYERVQSADAAIEPSQQTLLTAAEEPAELPQPEPEPVLSDLPGVDLNPIASAVAAEPVRVAEAGGDASPIAVLTPRRVRTLTVNPDGTLVAAEAVPSTSLQELRGENPALIEAASRPLDALATGTTPSQDAAPAAEGDPAPGVPMPSMKPGTEPVRVAAAAPAESQPAPVVTEAPAAAATAAAAPQPEPATIEVAALPEQAAPAAGGGYYVQISSQPSREAAEESSRTLGQRFSDVIAGRSMVIQSADIPGKGTYHRVRVAAGSQNEANELCQRLKSAGGSCFVSR